MGSNFIWSEGDGEGREDNDRASNQVGGLIIPDSGFIMSLLQLGNFRAFGSCVFNGIIGWHSHRYCWVLKCAVNSTSEAKCRPPCPLPTQPCPIHFMFNSRRDCFLPHLLSLFIFPGMSLTICTVMCWGKHSTFYRHQCHN